MAAKRDNERVELYARALIEAGRSAGRANADLEQWEQASHFSPEVMETLCTMHENGDQNLVQSVAVRYKEILDSEDKTVSVTVTTSVAMDDELRQRVSSKVEKDLGCPVFLVEKVDPSIMGGIILEYRGKRYDASVKAQLANVRQSLSSTFIGSDA